MSYKYDVKDSLTRTMEVVTGLGISFTIAFLLFGPATASTPIIMRTLSIVLPLILIGWWVGAKEFDTVFAAAVALGTIVVGATIAY